MRANAILPRKHNPSIHEKVSTQVAAWEQERALIQDELRLLRTRAISEGQPGKDLTHWALTWREIHRLEAQRDDLNRLLARARSLT